MYVVPTIAWILLFTPQFSVGGIATRLTFLLSTSRLLHGLMLTDMVFVPYIYNEKIFLVLIHNSLLLDLLLLGVT